MSRAIALLLTVATGTSGLVYEVTWERMLAVLLGSHAEATASVLAFFLGGLAVGYSLFGRLSRRIGMSGAQDGRRRLLLWYGAAEGAIGAYALAFEPLFQIARNLSTKGPSQPALAFVWDATLAAALVVPGAALMGATIPMLTQALSRSVRAATRIHAAIYGANTLGAFAGALSASYWLIPELGLVGTLRTMALVNFSAGLGFAAIAALRSPGTIEAASTAAPPRLGNYSLCAFLLGAAMMTLQTTVIRLGGLSLGASLFTFATVVSVFVLCIALGSLAVGALSRVPRALLPTCTWALFAAFLVLYLPIEGAPYYAHVLRSLFRDQPQAFLPFDFTVLLMLLALIGPAIALSGATLPLLFDRIRREHGELGDAAGRLYGWNTAGSLTGALLGGYALFHWLDLHHVYRLAVSALAFVAALLTPVRLGTRRLGPILAAPALLLVALLPPWSPNNLSLGAFRARAPLPATYAGWQAFAAKQWGNSKILFSDDDPTASIMVREQVAEDGRVGASIFTNGKSDGSTTNDYPTMALVGLLPAWLALNAERSFVVGYGTGVSAGEIAALDESREVIVAEISPAVAAAAPLFDVFNQGASQSPKIRIVRGDAYRVLLRSEGNFNLIVSEPSNPWVNGIEMLYSAEFLEAAKHHLAPGGVLCQWFHSYETDRETVELVLRTYASVFDHVAIWYGLGLDLFLIGFDDPEALLDLTRLTDRAARPDFRAGFARAGVEGMTELLAHELWPVDVLHALELQGPLHTLLHPRLAHTAARAFFVGGIGRLPSSAGTKAAELGSRNSLIRAYAAARGGLSEAERRAFVAETCTYRERECVSLLAQWQKEVPDSPVRTGLEARIRMLFGGQIRLGSVTPLSRFFGASVADPEDMDPVLHAQRESDRFIRHYHHAAPFSRVSLRALFERCAGDPTKAEVCAASRRKVEERLGSLDWEPPGPHAGDGGHP